MRAPDEFTLFKYSKSEWSEIEAAIFALTDRDLSECRSWLQLIGSMYQGGIATAGPLKRIRSRHRAYQLKVSNQTEKLLATLGRSILSEDRARESEERTGVCLGTSQRVRRWNDKLRSIMDRLTGLQAETLALLSEGDVVGIAPLKAKEIENPRILYHYLVLDRWETLGGELAFSRNRSGEITGPLPKYFFAVTRPVMRDSALALESLADVVGRQRDIRARQISN